MVVFNIEGLSDLIKVIGYVGIFAIVFAESGILLGAFLPGDSLLFTAGFLASQGYFDVALLVILIFMAAVLGDSVGYAFGHRFGPKLFKREDSLLFHKKHVHKTEEFYKKHGPKTIVLARFLPIARTFAPILAGVGTMRYSKFLFYNVLGGGIWASTVTISGYYLGKTIPGVDAYLLPIVAAIVVVSALPSLIHVSQDRIRAALKSKRKDDSGGKEV